MNRQTILKLLVEELRVILDEKKKKKKKKSAKDKMKCNDIRRIRKGEAGHGKKKFVVKACDKGKEKIIRFGDANMKIKGTKSKDRLKSFRARHKCKTPGSKLKARYWACRTWPTKGTVKKVVDK